MTDGFGAQGTRIAGVYSIARFFKLGYLHNPITQISDVSELVGSAEKHAEFNQVLSELNEYISFPHDEFPTKNPQHISIYNLGFRQLFYYGMRALFHRETIVLEICLPFGITDRLSIVSQYGKKAWSKCESLNFKSKSNHRTVVMHVRGSEHSPDKKRPQLGPKYYERTLYDLSRRFNRDFKLIVHTDFHLSDFNQSQKSKRVKAFEPFLRECEALPRVEVNHYADIRKVMFDMTHADVLVVSRSALPYLAGLLSNGEVVFPKCHGHSPLSGWLTQDCMDFISGS
jgi:hypothetical protein